VSVAARGLEFLDSNSPTISGAYPIRDPCELSSLSCSPGRLAEGRMSRLVLPTGIRSRARRVHGRISEVEFLVCRRKGPGHLSPSSIMSPK
jgi:hypothetical protein